MVCWHIRAWSACLYFHFRWMRDVLCAVPILMASCLCTNNKYKSCKNYNLRKKSDTNSAHIFETGRGADCLPLGRSSYAGVASSHISFYLFIQFLTTQATYIQYLCVAFCASDAFIAPNIISHCWHYPQSAQNNIVDVLFPNAFHSFVIIFFHTFVRNRHPHSRSSTSSETQTNKYTSHSYVCHWWCLSAKTCSFAIIRAFC